jgi:hypothetical protein
MSKRTRTRYTALTEMHGPTSKKLRELIMREARKQGGRKVAKRRKHKKARKTTRRTGWTHAKRVRAGKKAARTRRARHGRKAAPKRRRRVTRRRVTRRRRGALTLTVRSRRRIRMRRTPRGRYRTGTLRASYRGKRRRGHVTVKWARRNPTMAGLKDALMTGAALYGGFLGMRALTVVLKENVLSKITALNPSTQTNLYAKKAMACIPAAAVFGLSMFAGKFITNAKVLSGVQAGATLVLFDAIFTQFVMPQLGTATKYFQPGVGFGGYGGEYIRQRTPLPYQGYGAMAREAVAEYVQQPGMGAFDVNEALAGSEVQAMQTGYAAGSLAKTVFSS